MSTQGESPVFVEKIWARGHRNVTARHLTTFEVTKETSLTLRGDCVIAVAASKAPVDLDDRMKDALRDSRSKVTVNLAVGDIGFEAHGYGDPGLSLTHPAEMVFRKSRYVSGRTIMVGSDKAAADVPCDMLRALRNPDTVVELTLLVTPSRVWRPAR